MYCLYIICDVWYYFFALCKNKRKMYSMKPSKKTAKDKLVKHCHLKEILLIVWRLWLWPCWWRELVGLSLVSIKRLIVMHVISKLQYTVFNSSWTDPPGQNSESSDDSFSLQVTTREREKKKEKVPGKYIFICYQCWSFFSRMCVGPFYLVLFFMELYGGGLVQYYNTVKDVYTEINPMWKVWILSVVTVNCVKKKSWTNLFTYFMKL